MISGIKSMVGGLLLHIELGTFYVWGSISINYSYSNFRSICVCLDEIERFECNIELYGYYLPYSWFNYYVLSVIWYKNS